MKDSLSDEEEAAIACGEEFPLAEEKPSHGEERSPKEEHRFPLKSTKNIFAEVEGPLSLKEKALPCNRENIHAMDKASTSECQNSLLNSHNIPVDAELPEQYSPFIFLVKEQTWLINMKEEYNSTGEFNLTNALL